VEATLRSAAETALEAVREHGVEGEAYLLYDKELTIETSGGKVETLKEAEEIGIGIRVFNGGRMGFAYSTDLSPKAIKETVKDAVHISAYTDADEYNLLPEGGQNYPVMATYDAGIGKLELEAKIELARHTEKAARAYDPRVVLVDRAGYDDSEFSVLIMNSRGLYAYGRGSHCGLHISLAAREKDDTQNGFAFAMSRNLTGIDPIKVGEEGAMRAVRSLQAKTIASARIPCIMEPYVVTRFMGLLASSIQADAVQKGKSMLADKLGRSIASAHFNLVDDAVSLEGMASFPFDGEGVASQRKVIIDQGILQGFLYDNYTGLKAGQASTGNGVRSSFRSLPGVGETNLILAPGSKEPNILMSDISTGMYITEVMGMHTANPISGEFSVGAAGIMIEQGQLTYPVRGVTIAGNLWEMLRDVEAVGSDLRFFGGRAASTIRLTNLSIGGS